MLIIRWKNVLQLNNDQSRAIDLVLDHLLNIQLLWVIDNFSVDVILMPTICSTPKRRYNPPLSICCDKLMHARCPFQMVLSDISLAPNLNDALSHPCRMVILIVRCRRCSRSVFVPFDSYNSPSGHSSATVDKVKKLIRN